MTNIDFFQASDLATKRREFISAGRDGEALLRDTDGLALRLAPLAVWKSCQEILEIALNFVRTESALERSDVRASDLPYAWLLEFDSEDRQEFLREMRDALSLAGSTSDVTPVSRCLNEWMTTAQSLADPVRRAILTGAGDDDYNEVNSPLHVDA